MKLEILTDEPHLIIHRLILYPNEATYWHTDQCRRFSVIISGHRLLIEYQNLGTSEEVKIYPGKAGWDDPESRIHRAVNIGCVPYEEIVTFYRETAIVEPQLRHHLVDSV